MLPSLISFFLLKIKNNYLVTLILMAFYITLAKEMITRFPLPGKYHKLILCPEIVFHKDRKKINELPELCPNTYKNFMNENSALNEWRSLPLAFECDEVGIIAKLPLDAMEMNIFEYRNFTGCLKFKNISKLASDFTTFKC
jgi:hypothetical protein